MNRALGLISTLAFFILHFSYHVQAAPPLQSASLHYLAQKGSVQDIQSLLSKGAKINGEDAKGYTALLYAAQRGDMQIVKLLLEHGANISERTRLGSTALHHSAGRGHEAVTQLLLESGSSPEITNQSGESPLLWAASGGHSSAYKLLVKAGANESSREKLILYAALSEMELFKNLLAKGMSINTTGKGGITPLFLAAQSGNLGFLNYILEKGANLRRRIDNGKSALHYAANVSIARRLMEVGLIPQEKSRLGIYPLHSAAQTGQSDLVEFYIQKGAPPDLPTMIKTTPLHLAAAAGHMETVKMLLNMKANPRLKNLRGHTPAFLAQRNGHIEIARLLESHQPGKPGSN